MSQEKNKYYSKKLEILEVKEKKIKKELKWIALFRLLSFVLLFLAIFVLIPRSAIIGATLTALLVVLFFALIKMHKCKSDIFNHTRALIELNEYELNALEYEYSHFLPGNEYIDHNHPYSYDMDLFGVGSLFQFLNRTVTVKGKEKLANSLSNETLDARSINRKQEAIKELSQLNEEIQDFRAYGALGSDSEEDIIQLKKWVDIPLYYMKSRFWLLTLNILPVITLTSIILSFFYSSFYSLFIFLFLLQYLFIGIRFKHTSAEHALIGKRLDALKKYEALLLCLEKLDFKNEELKKIYNQLFTDQYSATRSIKKLSEIVKLFDSRLNMVAAIFLEGLLLWDIRCMIQLEKWKLKQGHELGSWIDSIAEFDTLVSLANFAFNNPEYTYPVISIDKIIHAKGLGHILIPSKQRVCNDFVIDTEGQFVIITGANMAGKSTFLRTIATSMVLSMIGAPVCATEFIFSPIKIFSSMRTSDSLNKNESYFYAELKRLKEMLDKLKEGEKIFIVLDEILKGTNSLDKQKGSKAVLEQIIKMNGTGIIATHDLELTKASATHPGRIKNVCFEIEIDNAAISFDYKIREGVTTKMNATLLMKQMGIEVDDFVS